MSRATPLAGVERKLLACLPHRSGDQARIAEFEHAFGASVMEAANAVANTIGIIEEKELAVLAEHFAGVLTGSLSTAAAQLGATGHPWIAEGQRWAVEAFFARIAEIRGAMSTGGCA